MEYSHKRFNTKRRKAIVIALSKPKIYMEIKQTIGLSRNNHLTGSLQELIRERIIKILTKDLREDRVYGLTGKGKNTRKKLMEKEGLNYFYRENPALDYNSYGWVVCGRQRKKVLKSLTAEPLKVSQIRERMDKSIGRTNTNDVLKDFVKKGLAVSVRTSTKKGKKNWIWYKLSEKGQAIKEQMLAL